MEPDTASRNSLRDSIITLPIWAVVLLALISAVSLVTALWVAATSQNNDIKSAALQTLLVLVPLASAVVAAIAVRRTSTAQIDRLVTGFLEKTMLERFDKWCAAPAQV
jgi:ABC-type sugar transport system permease subunit